MTNEARYSIKALGIKEIKSLTLYEAQKELIRVFNDGTADKASLHISREGRTVAFLCEWQNIIKPMSQAIVDEIYCIKDDRVKL